ncbi:MAG TPA: HAD family hydrolase [Nocardioidaceae bacterium]|nr:HAD family hydrolase [Nocardioidaceae bacterium]
MSFSPKLVALDIDGTLFAPEPGAGTVTETLTPRVHAAVQRAVDAGAYVVLATGRSTYGVTPVWDLLGLPRDGEQVLCVASNGAVTFSYSPVEVLQAVTFDASEVVRELMLHVPQAMVAVEEIGVGYRVNRHFPEGEITGQMQLQSVEELVAEPVTRVIIRDPDASAESFIELAERLGLHGTNYFIGWTAWLDLAPEGVSKASALAAVAAQLGVAQADVLAIGDGRNDTDMLRWAGRGVAMGQAVDEVKAAADDVTLSVYDDGAAAELDRWF